MSYATKSAQTVGTGPSTQQGIDSRDQNPAWPINGNESGIRITTIVQQEDEHSGSEIPLNTLDFATSRHGFVMGRAWA